MNYNSHILDNAIKEISSLPGIGEKSALRLVLHILRQPKSRIEVLGNSVKNLINVVYCKECNNISDSEICYICENKFRDSSLLCVVEDIRDLIAIENAGGYNGIYHVLGGRISPMEGISVEDLKIEELEKRIREKEMNEVFLALSSTIEGDTTSYYLYKKLLNYPIKITSMARGISVGNEIEYIDEITLANSVKNRILYEQII